MVAEEVKVKFRGLPDYVFEDNYNLPDLKETEAFGKNNKHFQIYNQPKK